MDLLSQLSDDQVVLIGCCVTLVACGGVMSLSYYLGGHAQPKRNTPHLSSGSRDTKLRIAPVSVSTERTDRKKAA